jgi:small-conductance mechanosensitive channel
MQPLLDSLLVLEGSLVGRLAATFATLVVVWVLRWLVLALVQPRLEQARSHYHWRKSATYVAIAISILAIAQIWWSGFSGLATFLGLLSAGLAVALRDWIANFFGWAYLVTWRPFTVGDRIEIGDVAGDVIDVGMLATTLLEIGNWVRADQSTGRVVYVPNGRFLTTNLANYTTGMAFLWHEVRVVVTFESNWRAAKEILNRVVHEASADTVAEAEQALQDATKKWLITYSTLTPIVYTQVEDSGVALTVRYLTPPRRRRGTEEALWEAILDAFAERDDIDLAYPTRRLYDASREG